MPRTAGCTRPGTLRGKKGLFQIGRVLLPHGGEAPQGTAVGAPRTSVVHRMWMGESDLSIRCLDATVDSYGMTSAMRRWAIITQ